MRAKSLLALLILAAAGCQRSAPPQPVATTTRPQSKQTPAEAMVDPRPPDDSEERLNLLSIAHGAGVVSRTGEAMLNASAARAIDSDPASEWLSPPSDPRQTLTFSLPSLSQITKLGLLSDGRRDATVHSVLFELSTDGEHFTTIKQVDYDPSPEMRLFDLPPTPAAYVRVSTLDGPGRFVHIRSIEARGTPLQPADAGPLEGCWSVNGLPASFKQTGVHASGVIADTTPLFLEGGTDGSCFRFTWIRGKELGIAAITATHDGKHLTGLEWHREPIPANFWESWFGDRQSCSAPAPGQPDVMSAFLSGYSIYPLYGLGFDAHGAVDEQASATVLAQLDTFLRKNNTVPYRFIAREFHSDLADQNRGIAQVRIHSFEEALRRRGIDTSHFQFVAAGSDNPHHLGSTDLLRSLLGGIEIEAPEPAKKMAR